MPKGFGEYNASSYQKGELILSAVNKRVNPKVIYIPAERNFVSAVPTLKNYSDKNDNLQSFVNDWFDAKRIITITRVLTLTTCHWEPRVRFR